MNPPQEYVELIETFLAMDKKAVKLEELTKIDIACLTMVAYLMNLPVEVRHHKKQTILVRKDDTNNQR